MKEEKEDMCTDFQPTGDCSRLSVNSSLILDKILQTEDSSSLGTYKKYQKSPETASSQFYSTMNSIKNKNIGLSRMI
jgi:hypothetical protein